MSLKITSHPEPRDKGFEFTPENQKKAEAYIARYPEGRQASAVLYLLYLAQEQNGNWVSPACIEHVARLLDMAPIRVYEVSSFYTMFNQKPVGDHLVQVCRTSHCWLNGSDAITKACLEAAGTSKLGETSEDGKVTVTEVECLGACCNAPMFQVNDRDYYEDLTPERAKEIVAALRKGEKPEPGSQKGRLSSIPEGGPTTLQDTFGKEGA
ncbi:MAG: NADH-quinone oxidoreductase subunit NuoE [Limibacillus sp.]|jgi:NADH-quinone oxidoreductase subunit E